MSRNQFLSRSLFGRNSHFGSAFEIPDSEYVLWLRDKETDKNSYKFREVEFRIASMDYRGEIESAENAIIGVLKYEGRLKRN